MLLCTQKWLTLWILDESPNNFLILEDITNLYFSFFLHPFLLAQAQGIFKQCCLPCAAQPPAPSSLCAQFQAWHRLCDLRLLSNPWVGSWMAPVTSRALPLFFSVHICSLPEDRSGEFGKPLLCWTLLWWVFNLQNSLCGALVQESFLSQRWAADC